MQVTVTIRTFEQQFAGGTVGGNWWIVLAAATDPATPIEQYEGASPSTSFDVTDGDTYVVRGARLDAGGSVLGPIATAQFTAGDDLVPIDVADSISVVSSPVMRPAAAKGAKR